MSRLRTIGLVLASLLTILATCGVVLRVRASGEWRAALERAEGVRTSYESGLAPRDVLRGEAVDGSAFEHYDRAIALGEELGWGRDLVPQRLSAPDEEQRAARDEHAARVRPLLAELARGASSRDARMSVDWATGADYPVEHDQRGAYLCDLAAMVALSELDAGRPAAAADVLLDSLQYACDLLDAPTLFEAREGADALVSKGLVAFGEQGGWTRLPPEERARVALALVRLDERLPTIGADLEVNEAISLRQLTPESARAETDSPLLRGVVLTALPFLQALGAEEANLLLDFTRDYRAAHERAPRQALETTARRYRARADDERQRFLLDVHVKSAGMRLRALARLRLLRRALAELSGDEAVPTHDRLGCALRAETTDGVLRVDLETPCYSGLVLELPVE